MKFAPLAALKSTLRSFRQSAGNNSGPKTSTRYADGSAAPIAQSDGRSHPSSSLRTVRYNKLSANEDTRRLTQAACTVSHVTDSPSLVPVPQRRSAMKTPGAPRSQPKTVSFTRPAKSDTALMTVLESEPGQRTQALEQLFSKIDHYRRAQGMPSSSGTILQNPNSIARLNRLSKADLLTAMATEVLLCVPESQKAAFTTEIFGQARKTLKSTPHEQARVVAGLCSVAGSDFKRGNVAVYNTLKFQAADLHPKWKEFVRIRLLLSNKLEVNRNASPEVHARQIKNLNKLLGLSMALPAPMRIQIGKSIFASDMAKPVVQRMAATDTISRFAEVLKNDLLKYPHYENIGVLNQYGGTLQRFMPFEEARDFAKKIKAGAKEASPEMMNMLFGDAVSQPQAATANHAPPSGQPDKVEVRFPANSVRPMMAVLGLEAGKRTEALNDLFSYLARQRVAAGQPSSTESKQLNAYLIEQLNKLPNRELLPAMATYVLPEVPDSEKAVFAARIFERSAALLKYEPQEQAETLARLCSFAMAGRARKDDTVYKALERQISELSGDWRKFVQIQLSLSSEIHHSPGSARKLISHQSTMLNHLLGQSMELPAPLRIQVGRSVFGNVGTTAALGRLTTRTKAENFARVLKGDLLEHPSPKNIGMLRQFNGTLEQFLPPAEARDFSAKIMSGARITRPQ